MRTTRCLITFFLLLLVFPFLAYAYDFDPSASITGRDLYNISNFINISAQKIEGKFYGDGSEIQNLTFSGFNNSWNESRGNEIYASINIETDNSSWNETRGNSIYLLQSQESNLNVNNSNFWSSVSSYQTKWFGNVGNVLTFAENLIHNWINGNVTEVKSYSDTNDTILHNSIINSNNSLKGYSDINDTILHNLIFATNDSTWIFIKSEDFDYNLSTWTYINSLNQSMKIYVDSKDLLNNNSIKGWTEENYLNLNTSNGPLTNNLDIEGNLSLSEFIFTNYTGSYWHFDTTDRYDEESNLFIYDIDNEQHHLNVDLTKFDEMRANTFTSTLDIRTFCNVTGHYIEINTTKGNNIGFIYGNSTTAVSDRFDTNSSVLQLTSGTNSTPVLNRVLARIINNVPTWTVTTAEPTYQHVMASRVLVGDSCNVYGASLQEDGDNGIFKRIQRTNRKRGLLYEDGLEYNVSVNDIQIGKSQFINGIYDQFAYGLKNSSVDGFYLILSNGTYKQCTSFAEITEYADGNSIGTNKEFNVMFGMVPYDSSARIYAVIQDKPTIEYRTMLNAYTDKYGTLNLYPSEEFLKTYFLPVARMIINSNSNEAQILPNELYAEDYRGGIAGGISSGGGISESDPLSVHFDGTTPLTGNWDVGAFNISTSEEFKGDLTWSYLQNYPTDCTGNEFVKGVGDTLTCATPTDTPYTAGGTLLDLTGTTFSVNEGTLTDTKYCTYEAGTGIECNSEGGSGTSCQYCPNQNVNESTSPIFQGIKQSIGHTIIEYVNTTQDIIVVNNEGNDVDFRVEMSITGNGLYVDYDNDFVGIASNSVTSGLENQGTLSVGGLMEMSSINYHKDDLDTYQRYDTDKQTYRAGGVDMLTLLEDDSQDKVNINEDSNDVDFQVEGDNDVNLLYTNASVDRIGIGTNSPATKLEVNGDITSDNITAYKLVSPYLDSTYITYEDTFSTINFYSAGNEQMYISNGVIRINPNNENIPDFEIFGTTSGSSILYANSGDDDLIINENGNPSVNFRVEGDSDTNLLYSDAPNDRVGIGTATPSAKLDVQGDINTTGNIELQDTKKIILSKTLNMCIFSTINSSGNGGNLTLSNNVAGVTC